MNLKWSTQSAAGFSKAAGLWDELNSCCANLPFLSSDFVQPLLEIFGRGDEVLAIGTESGRPVAAAIVIRLGLGRWRLFQPSQLPLGPLLAMSRFSLDEIGQSLLKSLSGPNFALGLSQLDPAVNTRPEPNAIFSTLDYIQTAWVDIEGEFEEYWRRRGANLRQNMRKQRNKLRAEGVEPTLEVIRDQNAVAQAIAQYGALESSSWKSLEGTAVGADNQQGMFYKTMLERFCQAGSGVIYRYRLGDRIAAMDLCIESGDTLVILKTAYDSSNKSLSPAFLMREEQFQQLFSKGNIRRVEFFGKLMDWHTKWTEHSRTLYHANVYRHWTIPKLLGVRSALRSSQSNAH